MIGVYQASALTTVLAAADAVDGPLKHRHRLVLSGGIAAALIGPAIGKNPLHSLPVEYTSAYLAAMAPVPAGYTCFAFALLLAAPRPAAPSPGGRCRALFTVQAVLFCTVGYCLMLMVMLASPWPWPVWLSRRGCRER